MAYTYTRTLYTVLVKRQTQFWKPVPGLWLSLTTASRDAEAIRAAAKRATITEVVEDTPDNMIDRVCWVADTRYGIERNDRGNWVCYVGVSVLRGGTPPTPSDVHDAVITDWGQKADLLLSVPSSAPLKRHFEKCHTYAFMLRPPDGQLLVPALMTWDDRGRATNALHCGKPTLREVAPINGFFAVLTWVWYVYPTLQLSPSAMTRVGNIHGSCVYTQAEPNSVLLSFLVGQSYSAQYRIAPAAAMLKHTHKSILRSSLRFSIRSLLSPVALLLAFSTCSPSASTPGPHSYITRRSRIMSNKALSAVSRSPP